MSTNEEISPLAALRSECLHLAVRMLAYCDAGTINPQDAIRLAEEYVVWILGVGGHDSAAEPGNARALQPLRGDTAVFPDEPPRH